MRKHFIVLIIYTLIALAMTWPLLLNFTTAIPGVEGDAGSFVWALGWMKTALVDLHVNPFHTDYVFYPLGGATQLLWAVSLIAFISIPLQYLFGLIATHNILYLAATVLTAYGTYLLAEASAGEFKIQNSKSCPEQSRRVKIRCESVTAVSNFFVVQVRERTTQTCPSPLAPCAFHRWRGLRVRAIATGVWSVVLQSVQHATHSVLHVVSDARAARSIAA